MKNTSTLIFLFFSILSFGQINKHSLKIGMQIGGTSHLGAPGIGYHAKYEYNFLNQFSAGIGFGQLHGKSTQRGTSRGIAGTFTWDNSYEVESTEGYNYIEMSGFYSYFNRFEYIKLRFGGGITFLSNWLNYDKDLTTFRGVIVSSEKTRQVDNVAMMNIIFDNNFTLTDQLFINCQFIFRRAIQEQKSLVITTFFDGGGRGSSTSQVDLLGSVVVGLGYRF